MSLLQISEPDEINSKPKLKCVVGIDLGTTNSLIGSLVDGKVIFFPDDDGNLLIPSVVNYSSQNSCRVGSSAQTGKMNHSSATISSVKRLIGKGIGDVNVKDYPYHLSKNSDKEKNELLIQTPFGSISPIKVSADILVCLRKKAEKYFQQSIDGAVITVPAYFDDGQRQATKDAARIAGIDVLRLINEPTAAALAYGLETKKKGIFVIFDMGGGTFDVSVLRLSGGLFEVLATGGDSSLGGDDFDKLIVKYWLEKNYDIGYESLKIEDLKSILILARETKERLSNLTNEEDLLSVKWKNSNNENFSFNLNESIFQKISAKLLNKAVSACKKTLLDSKIENVLIDDVILVGGTTRLKVLREAVRDLFNRQPRIDINPDEVVAVGAALQADLLSGNKSHESDWLLLDVLPLSLGIETMGGLVEKVIDRNSSIPASKAQEFTTFKDGQTSMSIHILQGERDLVSECRSLAKFEIAGIPPKPAGIARVEVSFQVDADGLLSVTAVEQTTGTTASIDVKPSYGISDEEVTKMIQDGVSNAYHDKDARAIREAMLELKRNVIAVEEALVKDGNLLSTEEYEKISSTMMQAKGLIKSSSEDRELIENVHEKLNSYSDPLVERRMNRAIESAIVGKTIDSVEKTTPSKKN